MALKEIHNPVFDAHIPVEGKAGHYGVYFKGKLLETYDEELFYSRGYSIALKMPPKKFLDFDAAHFPAGFRFNFGDFKLCKDKVAFAYFSRKDGKISCRYYIIYDNHKEEMMNLNPMKIMSIFYKLAKKKGYKTDTPAYKFSEWVQGNVIAGLPAKGNLFQKHQEHVAAIEGLFEQAEKTIIKEIIASA